VVIAKVRTSESVECPSAEVLPLPLANCHLPLGSPWLVHSILVASQQIGAQFLLSYVLGRNCSDVVD